jgi:uncharacterized damage-inducible protein DinB
VPNTLQDFLAAATLKASADLTTAFLRLPEDKRAWSPAETARTALDMVVECALLNGYSASLIKSREWSNETFGLYGAEKAALMAKGWDAVAEALQSNTASAVAAIREAPDADLAEPIVMPWQTQSLAEVLAYCYWNMSYHEGQINYLASILGCLD